MSSVWSNCYTVDPERLLTQRGCTSLLCLPSDSVCLTMLINTSASDCLAVWSTNNVPSDNTGDRCLGHSALLWSHLLLWQELDTVTLAWKHWTWSEQLCRAFHPIFSSSFFLALRLFSTWMTWCLTLHRAVMASRCVHSWSYLQTSHVGCLPEVLCVVKNL